MKLSSDQAAQWLLKGQIVAVPTETVYGLAVSLKYPKKIKEVFELKGRPHDNPLIVHVATISQLKKLVQSIPKSFFKIKSLWPGPLTIVFKANLKAVPSKVRAGLKTVAIRIPDHPQLLTLLKKTGPIAAPSANVSGRPSPTTRRHVESDLGAEFPVLDGGACRHGVESTVISLDDDSWQLLRLGAVPPCDIESKLGEAAKTKTNRKKPVSPGQKYRHYAPLARLRLCFDAKTFKRYNKFKKYQAVLGFSDTKTDKPMMSLGKRHRFASNLKKLYASLRELDRKGYKDVLVDMDFTVSGLGETLYERLIKAAG